MWTKNQSLYFLFPFRVFISLFLSVIFFVALAFSADFILLNIFNVNTEEQQLETTKLVEEIRLRIEENSLSFNEANELATLWSNSGYTLHFLSSSEDYSNNNVNAINDVYYIYDVAFSDINGSVLIISNIIRVHYITYFILATLLSIGLFLTLILKEMSRIIKTIKMIEQGVNIIANDDLQYKIKVGDEKEILSLVENINRMGQTIYLKNQQEYTEEINKRTLITNLSHDIRTPLTSINGYVDLILAKSEQTSDIYMYANIAKNNSIRLQKLIDDLFLYSKLISNDAKYELKEYNASKLLWQIVELRDSEIAVSVSQNNAIILADLNSFHRAISNLLDNAEKYKCANSTIEMTCYSTEKYVIISIQNNTLDDLTDKIDLLTNRLYKAEENRSDGSSGLGLSIVTELLKTMNANLSLSFEQGIFTAKITIPIHN